VSQVLIDPVSSSSNPNVRAPSRSDQKGDSDDFRALVDSNTNAAASATAQPYDRSRSTRPAQNSAQNDNRSPDTSRSHSTTRDDRTSSQQRTQDRSSGSQVQSSSADKTSKAKNQSDKADKRRDDSDSQNPVTTSDGSNANAAAAAQNAPATSPTTDSTPATSDTATTASNDLTPAVTTDTTAAQGTPISSEQDGQSQPADPSAQQPAITVPVTAIPVVLSATPAIAAPAVAETPVQNSQIGSVKGVTKAGAPPVNAQAAAQQLAAGPQAAGDQAQSAQANGDSPAAASDGDGNGDGNGQTKPGVTVAAKADAAQIASSGEREHAGAGSQTLQPDSSFQSLLNLQSPPQIQQPQTGNFTVTNAGPTGSAQALTATVPLNGIAADIAAKATAGNTSFQIRLDPAELGRIDVRLEVDKHGQVTSHLTVEHPATLDLLRNDAPRLQQALENAGLKTGDSGLQFSLRDQSSQNRNDQGNQQQNSHRVIISEDVPVARVASTNYSRAWSSSSGVDISI